ncbi:hypothetical protein ACIRON_02725 [Nocardioides sp. NPDC101246]
MAERREPVELKINEEFVRDLLETLPRIREAAKRLDAALKPRDDE